MQKLDWSTDDTSRALSAPVDTHFASQDDSTSRSPLVNEVNSVVCNEKVRDSQHFVYIAQDGPQHCHQHEAECTMFLGIP